MPMGAKNIIIMATITVASMTMTTITSCSTMCGFNLFIYSLSSTLDTVFRFDVGLQLAGFFINSIFRQQSLDLGCLESGQKDSWQMTYWPVSQLLEKMQLSKNSIQKMV